METYDAIISRRSIPVLQGPRPDRVVIERLLQAATMAPNHHLTQPWRFVVVTGDALRGLAEAFATTAAEAGANASAAHRLPTLAPVIIAVIDRSGQDHHVPEIDEHYAVGAAMQNLLLAAHDAGLGGMIRTGIHTGSAHVRRHLGVGPDEAIAGFVYLGHPPAGPPPGTSRRKPIEHVTEWRGFDATPTERSVAP